MTLPPVSLQLFAEFARLLERYQAYHLTYQLKISSINWQNNEKFRILIQFSDWLAKVCFSLLNIIGYFDVKEMNTHQTLH